jgi:hypothetical protein
MLLGRQSLDLNITQATDKKTTAVASLWISH